MYENIDAVGAAYQAAPQSLDVFEGDLRREWEEVSKMSKEKRKTFVDMAKMKIVSIIGECEKTREKGVQLQEEIRNLQSTLKMKDELEDATKEWHDAQESL